jgi:hypothetical protein
MKKMTKKERKKGEGRVETKRNNLMTKNLRLQNTNKNKRARKKLKSMIQMRKCTSLKRRVKIRSNSLMNKSLKSRNPRKRRVKKTRERKTILTTQTNKIPSKKNQPKPNRANNKTKKERRVPSTVSLWTNISRKPS